METVQVKERRNKGLARWMSMLVAMSCEIPDTQQAMQPPRGNRPLNASYGAQGSFQSHPRTPNSTKMKTLNYIMRLFPFLCPYR